MKHSCMYSALVFHHRLRPKVHRFRYKVTSWLVDLDELDELDHSLKLFSRNRLNWISFYDRDYGDGSDTSLKQQVSDQLECFGSKKPARVSLLCFPRMLGYTFNPLSVYFCYTKNNTLFAVLYEVSNTFGERHSYVIPCNEQPEGASNTNRQRAQKKMHVSPFMAMDYCYGFRVKRPEQSLSIAINMVDDQGVAFFASLTGNYCNLSNASVWKQLIKMPVMTFKVIGGILWEAARLYLKGLKVYRHQPKNDRISATMGQNR